VGVAIAIVVGVAIATAVIVAVGEISGIAVVSTTAEVVRVMVGTSPSAILSTSTTAADGGSTVSTSTTAVDAGVGSVGNGRNAHAASPTKATNNTTVKTKRDRIRERFDMGYPSRLC
jgi:hypothetical protein